MADKAPKSAAHRRRWTIARSARVLLFWYTVVTIAFRCPSSSTEITDTSPWMCKPYFEIREQVGYDAYAAPYVDAYILPYVDKYITPNVDRVRPYTHHFNSKFYLPFRQRAITLYNTHGATRIDQVFGYFDREWEQNAKPYVDQYVEKAQEQYKIHLEPYVSKVLDPIYPQLLQAQGVVIKQYHENAAPLYRKSIPYVQAAYDKCYHVAVTVGYPYGAWATNGAVGFVTRKIWPSLRILYGQNVEPQLSKISERLGSYWDAKRLEAAVGAVDNVSEAPSSSSPTNSTSTTATSSVTGSAEPETSTSSSSDTTSFSSTSIYTMSEAASLESMESLGLVESILSMVTATAEPTPTHSESAVEASEAPASVPTPSTVAEKVTEDLKKWQTKFKLAADKGGDDLSERVTQITKRQIEGQVRSVGDALVFQLEDASKDAITNLKTAINQAVHDLPEDASEDDMKSSIEGIYGSIRSAGQNLKEKAQELRSWKVRFDANTDALVDAASRSTLNVIDSIRDLGLQEIGLRWASMDSVTYQDWAEYHHLKESFDEWREQVLKVATDHEGLVAAKREADEIEGRGMGIAEDAAKELARLKEVASTKIHALDSSDDFESRGMPAAAARLGQKIMNKITGGGATTTARSAVETMSSKASEVMADGSSTVTAAASDKAQPTFDNIIESIPSVDEATNKGSDAMSSVVEAASTATDSIAKGSSTIRDTISSVVGSFQPGDSVRSSASSFTDSAQSQAQEIIDGASQTIASNYDEASSSIFSGAASLTDDASISPLSSASSYLSHASHTVLDDAPSSSHIIESASSAIAPSASSLSSTVSSQLYAGVDAVKDQIPIHSVSSSSVSSQFSTVTEDVASSASSFASTVTPAGSSAFHDASGSVAPPGSPSMEGLGKGVVDGALEASKSVQSLVSEAGEAWAEVTRSLGMDR